MAPVGTLGMFVHRACLACGIAIAALAVVSCMTKRSEADGLKPGLNYMQPVKWRLTCTYRVRQIIPEVEKFVPRPGESPAALRSAVGRGTYEVWLVGPQERDGVRGVHLLYSNPPPQRDTPSTDESGECLYYDLAPGDLLPGEVQITAAWEFVTFEEYTYWGPLRDVRGGGTAKGLEEWLGEEPPILLHAELARQAQDCRDPDGRVVDTALNCYNYIHRNFQYDETQPFRIIYNGQSALLDTFRTWQSKSGQCDELSSVLVAMLRSAGIPARTVAGLAYEPDLAGGGHTWAEFWLMGAGWVPVDVAKGWNTKVINAGVSPLGSKRGIPVEDYYFGKHDPYRVRMYTGWNYRLVPAPRTPDAAPVQQWLIFSTERYSGVKRLVRGFPGPAPLAETTGAGWRVAEGMAGTNWRAEVELLGPPSQDELEPLLRPITAEGGHYLPVAVAGRFPVENDALSEKPGQAE